VLAVPVALTPKPELRRRGPNGTRAYGAGDSFERNRAAASGSITVASRHSAGGRDVIAVSSASPADFKTRLQRLLTNEQLKTSAPHGARRTLAQIGPNEAVLEPHGHSDGHTEIDQQRTARAERCSSR